MTKDDRDILEVLQAELDFIEKGGYGRSVRTPWLPTTLFQDAPSCVCFPYHNHDDECALMQFVPPERRSEGLPCHFIPLNRGGETAADVEARGDQSELEEKVKNWLRATIKRIEEERVEHAAV